MFLLSARRAELEVRRDDDTWYLLRKSLRASASSFVSSSGWDLSEFSWKSPLKSSLLTSWSRVGVDFLSPWSLPDNFTVPSAIGNMIFHLFLDVNTSFVLSLRAWISDASNFPSSSVSATKMSPFQIPPRSRHIGRTFLIKLSHQIGGAMTGLVQKSNDVQPLHPNGMTGPLNGSPNRLSQCVFPSAWRSWTFRRWH